MTVTIFLVTAILKVYFYTHLSYRLEVRQNTGIPDGVSPAGN